MPESAQVKVTLHPNAVVAPALRAVEQSVDMVSFHMQSLEASDLTKPPNFDSSRFQMRFTSESISPEERRTRYANWVLSKGFQDLARGIRGTLEEAYFYIYIGNYLVRNSSNQTTLQALQDQIQQYRIKASDVSFPELMTNVSKGLTSPLHFEKEFLSLQKVRNCLEHRDGVVGEKDLDKNTKSLKLSLPQLKMYREEDGKQIELGKGSFVEKDTKVFLRNEVRDREFKLGERIVFNPDEFHDIGYGCWVFVQDLGSKLPQIKSSDDGVVDAASTQDLLDTPSRNANKLKLKARLPRGLADRGPAEIAATRRMTDAIRAVYERYGFDPVETPAIEYTDALGKFLPDLDRPNEGVFSFKDDDEQWLSLRYDLTAPLARYVAENFQNIALPYRSYRFGWVFRNEKPGPGRFRQFMQFDADTVGSASMAADAEICMMAADTMEALGIQRGQYVVKVNSRKVLDGVMNTARVPEEKRLTVLRAFDKFDRLGLDGVRMLLSLGRKDESGDFTKGAELEADQIDRLIEFLEMGVEASQNIAAGKGSEYLSPQNIDQDAFLIPKEGSFYASDKPDPNNPSINGWNELEQIRTLVRKAGYGLDQIRIDPSVVRGLEYYTGPVYEVELLLDTKDEKGRPVRFGSVGGGGRYDGLVSRFRGQPVPATGFSIGVSRLQAALTMLGKLDTRPAPGPVLVTVLDHDRVPDYQNMVAQLRSEGIRAELYLGSRNHNVGQQLKYADRRGSPCAVIQGGDEKARGEVQIRDLIQGGAPSDTKDRDEHLKKQAEAQFAVAEDKLVEAVRQVLTRHGVAWD